MSCIFSDVSGHSIKSVFTTDEQVLPRPDSVVGEQGGPATTPQESTHRDATNPVTEPPVDEVLSVPKTQSDRLSFPNLHGTAKEDEDEDKDEEDEEEEEQDDEDDEEDDEEDEEEDGYGEEGSPDEGEDREVEKEDDVQADVEEEGEDNPAQEGSASTDEVGSIFPLPLSCTVFYYEPYDVHWEVLFRA